MMKSLLITQNYRDYVKSITLSSLIFQLENIFSYHLLVIIPLLVHIWCPDNIRESRVLHKHQNLVSR